MKTYSRISSKLSTFVVASLILSISFLFTQTANATLYHVGDTYHENGISGVIYWIESGAIAAGATTMTQGKHFLLFSPQLGSNVNWTEANSEATNYGSGWHLPKGGPHGTLPYAEFALLGDFHALPGNTTYDFPDGNYWGSEYSLGNSHAWLSGFGSTPVSMNNVSKLGLAHVRAVYLGTFAAPTHHIGDIYNGGIIYWMANATGQPNTEYLLIKSADVGTSMNWSAANGQAFGTGWHLPTGGAPGTVAPGDEIWKLVNFHAHLPHYPSDNLVVGETYWGASINASAAWYFKVASQSVLGAGTLSKTLVNVHVRPVYRGIFP